MNKQTCINTTVLSDLYEFGEHFLSVFFIISVFSKILLLLSSITAIKSAYLSCINLIMRFLVFFILIFCFFFIFFETRIVFDILIVDLSNKKGFWFFFFKKKIFFFYFWQYFSGLQCLLWLFEPF